MARVKHIYGIDVLRFAAAMAVVLYHFAGFSADEPIQSAPEGQRAFEFLYSWTSAGWIGVQFFFVLSGFVIAFSAARQTALAFLSNRAVRILPVLWMCSTIAYLAIAMTTGDYVGYIDDWVRSVILSPKGPYIDGVVWTLVVEMIFYLLTAAVIALSASRGGYVVWMDRVALGLVLWTAIYVVVHLSLLAINSPSVSQITWFGLTVLLLHHGAFFGLGMMLCGAVLDGLTPRRVVAMTLATLVCCLQIALKAGLDQGALNAIALWSASMALMTLAIRYRDRLPSPRFAAFCDLLGRMSYPIYLGHFTLGMYLIPELGTFVASPALLFTVSLSGVLGLAWVLAQFAEPPLKAVARTALTRKLSPQG